MTFGREAFAAAHDHDEPLDAGEQMQVMAQLQTVFERMHDAAAEPLELEKKIEFDYVHKDVKHRMVAKIDRIDRGPAGLRGGNHAEVARWRLRQSQARTPARRPDLMEQRGLRPLGLELLDGDEHHAEATQ